MTINLSARGKIILSLILIVVVLAGYFAWQNHTNTAERLAQATVLTAKQATDINTLENKLQINKQNAELTAAAITKAQTGQLQPVTNFIIQAASPDQAAQQVANKINNKDSSLPPVALEKTDRTIVSSKGVDITYTFNPVPFERIRRITVYLVGSTDRWCDSKRAEEHDRVKHG